MKNHEEDRQADSESASYQPNDTGQVNFFFFMNEDNNQSKGSAKLYGDFNIIVFIIGS